MSADQGGPVGEIEASLRSRLAEAERSRDFWHRTFNETDHVYMLAQANALKERRRAERWKEAARVYRIIGRKYWRDVDRIPKWFHVLHWWTDHCDYTKRKPR